jgi:hypothetical protein
LKLWILIVASCIILEKSAILKKKNLAYSIENSSSWLEKNKPMFGFHWFVLFKESLTGCFASQSLPSFLKFWVPQNLTSPPPPPPKKNNYVI